MPMYAFVCAKCHHEFDELVPMGKLAPCPKCGSVHVEKQITAPAAVGSSTSNSSSSPTPRSGGSCGHGCGCH